VLFPFLAPTLDCGEPLSSDGTVARKLDGGGASAFGEQGRLELLEKVLGVGDDTESCWVVAPDLGRVDIDVDELRRWDGVGVSVQPRARRPVIEARAKGENNVS